MSSVSKVVEERGKVVAKGENGGQRMRRGEKRGDGGKEIKIIIFSAKMAEKIRTR